MFSLLMEISSGITVPNRLVVSCLGFTKHLKYEPLSINSMFHNHNTVTNFLNYINLIVTITTYPKFTINAQ